MKKLLAASLTAAVILIGAPAVSADPGGPTPYDWCNMFPWWPGCT